MINLSPQHSQIEGLQSLGQIPQTLPAHMNGSMGASTGGNMNGNMGGSTGGNMGGNANVTSPILCQENSTSPLCNMGGIIVGGGSSAGNNNSVTDAFPQSLKHLLTQNLGRTMLAMFLIGTQNNMLLQGVLTDVGNDYIVLYDKDRDSYITGDYYALKFVEFMPEEGQQNTAP